MVDDNGRHMMAKRGKINYNASNKKNEMITKLMQEVRGGSEVKFNINTETIMASAWMSLEEINKELM